MTVLEKIKKVGGFADFGMIVSMPLGYYANGEVMTTEEYYEARRLRVAGKIKVVDKITNQVFPTYLTRHLINGDLLK